MFKMRSEYKFEGDKTGYQVTVTFLDQDVYTTDIFVTESQAFETAQEHCVDKMRELFA